MEKKSDMFWAVFLGRGGISRTILGANKERLEKKVEPDKRGSEKGKSNYSSSTMEMVFTFLNAYLGSTHCGSGGSIPQRSPNEKGVKYSENKPLVEKGNYQE